MMKVERESHDDDGTSHVTGKVFDLMVPPPMPKDSQFPRPGPPQQQPQPPSTPVVSSSDPVFQPPMIPSAPVGVSSTPGSVGISKRHDDDDAVQSITIISAEPAPFFPTGSIMDSQYVYNVPDAFEQNPEILRAELLFYNTPLTEAYTQDVYDSLKNVQEQCSYDYYKYCATEKGAMLKMDFDQLFDVMFNMPLSNMAVMENRRALASKDNKALHAHVFDYFHQFYTGEALTSLMQQGAIAPISGPVTKTAKKLSDRIPEAKNNAASVEELVKKTSKHGGKRFFAKAQDRRRNLMMEHHHESKQVPHGNEFLRTPPLGPVIPPSAVTPELPPNFVPGAEAVSVARPLEPVHGNAHGPVAHGAPPRHPPVPPVNDYSDDSDSDSDDDDDDYFDRKKKPSRRHAFRGVRGDPHHPPHHEPEDRSFPGALGYGAQGDLCLYQHAPQLSQPCADAIDNLYALRESYYQESQEGASHGHCFFALFFVLATLGVFLFRKWRGQKKQKEMRTFLEGLHKDPELKAAVESRLGMTVPEAPKGCPFHREREANTTPRQASCLSKFFYTLFFLIFALVASFFITVTSLIATGLIVRGTGMEQVDAETGEVTEQPSSFVVLFILFAICSVQVCFVAKLVKAMKQWYRRNYESAPSAPSEPSAPSSTSSSTNFRYSLLAWLHPRMTAMSNLFQRNQQHDGYVPLRGNEESTEMISIGTVYHPNSSANHNAHAPQHPPSVTVYTGVPLNVNSTIVPVTATPMNNIHFV